MGLSNILKIQFKHFIKPILVFNLFWILIFFGLFIPTKLSTDIMFSILFIAIISNIVFNIVFGNLLFGSYAKTLIQIQNNRFNYILSSLIWVIASTLLSTITISCLRLNAFNFGFNKLSFEFILIILFIYLSSLSIGSLYGLYLKYHNNLRKIVLSILALTLIIVGYYNLNEFKSGIETIVNFSKVDYDSNIILCLLGFNFIVLTINSIYYCKLNILKAYSIE